MAMLNNQMVHVKLCKQRWHGMLCLFRSSAANLFSQAMDRGKKTKAKALGEFPSWKVVLPGKGHI